MEPRLFLQQELLEFHGNHNQKSHGNRYGVEEVSQATRSGGTTQDVRGRTITKGFAVGTGVDSKIVDADEFFSDNGVSYIKWRRAQQAKGRFENPSHHVGTWLDNGKVYLDVVEIIPDGPQAEAEATKLGADRNEKKIYHLTTGREIDTGGTGENL